MGEAYPRVHETGSRTGSGKLISVDDASLSPEETEVNTMPATLGFAYILLSSGSGLDLRPNRECCSGIADVETSKAIDVIAHQTISDSVVTPQKPFVRTSVARAGVTPSPFAEHNRTERASDSLRNNSHRIKHAAIGAGIGAGAGLLIGGAVGLVLDNGPGAGFIPATPIVAVEGIAIGVVAGLVVGALIP